MPRSSEDLDGDGEPDPGTNFVRRSFITSGALALASGAGLIIVGRGLRLRARF